MQRAFFVTPCSTFGFSRDVIDRGSHPPRMRESRSPQRPRSQEGHRLGAKPQIVAAHGPSASACTCAPPLIERLGFASSSIGRSRFASALRARLGRSLRPSRSRRTRTNRVRVLSDRSQGPIPERAQAPAWPSPKERKDRFVTLCSTRWTKRCPLKWVVTQRPAYREACACALNHGCVRQPAQIITQQRRLREQTVTTWHNPCRALRVSLCFRLSLRQRSPLCSPRTPHSSPLASDSCSPQGVILMLDTIKAATKEC